MAEPSLTTDPDRNGPSRRRWRTIHAVVAAGLLGASAAGAAFAWIDTSPQVDGFDRSAAVSAGPRPLFLASVADGLGRIDALPAAGAVAVDSYWLLGPKLATAPTTFMGRQFADTPNSERDARIAAIIIESIPVPSRNPLFAGHLPEVSVPLPPGNPLPRGRRQLASLTPADMPDVAPAPSAAPAEKPAPASPGAAEGVPLPTPGSGFALYDIEGRVVYMPNGDRLEAHSGYGDAMDDIRHVALKMRGPTPPNVYNVRMREARFHGVEALRLTPVGSSRMYGRDGFLVHPFMMGPRGDSNGCVSLKEHEKFLAAYRRGEVKKLVVVPRLPNSQKPGPASLLSWLLPKQNATPAQ